MVTVIPKIITTPYPRTRLPMYLYTLSIIVSCSLLYWNLLYCKNYDCSAEQEIRFGPKKHILQYFPVLAAPIIIFISLSWLIIAVHYSSTACIVTFNFMEMPSAVFCSMLGGVSSVIEIHFSIDVVNVEWTDQWLLSSGSSILLCLLHATIAFTLQ
ncbi:Protein CBG25938 [Caenorhabditis briggsae]|uniref:Uncharacterized protein n=2 Tax=Caenorhabditis briggsae TaxID=6238 RepID=A0AAE9DCW3_CAEBR|nr:Protein CBG25938 [Caenorhabditis briggsae]ULU01256.1 hypothetical protein L3Y34_001542 [Caenorhabditis briggsae]UMM23918.1 hypothetical protein L5515_004397 [Caenorhabditis briggsae]CAS00300.1 Protein CBG25938 [Caenorhabditis briggsae]